MKLGHHGKDIELFRSFFVKKANFCRHGGPYAGCEDPECAIVYVMES